MKDFLAALRAALVSLFAFTVLLGLGYPALVQGFAMAVGAHAATDLVGQAIDDPRYFWSRPSATGPAPYTATASAGTNLGPSNPALADAVAARVATLHEADPGNLAAIPADLVTASASGLDPHISPAAAYYQVARVARVRGLTEAAVRALVDTAIEPRTFGFLGEPRVNVVALDRALDHASGNPVTRAGAR